MPIIDASEGGAPDGRLPVQHVVVDDDSGGQRLDNLLFRIVKGVPKTHIYRVIRTGAVRVNKRRASAETRVAAGDVVRIPPLRRAPESDTAHIPGREFPVLLEDAWLLAVDKPAGVAVHGGSGVSFGVIEQLRRARPELRTLELVHRLDRATSGVLLLAKKRSALRTLQAQFRERQIRKTYLALVLGEWPERLKVLDQPLARYLLPSGKRRVKVVAATDPNAMRALTLVRVRTRWPGFTLLEVTLKTGRTHQIRVHLSAQGFPIAGDDKYGLFERNKGLGKSGLKRMFLHAWKMQCTHPATAQTVCLEAPLPADLPLPPDFGTNTG